MAGFPKEEDRSVGWGMDLERDHWGDDSGGPPPGAALPGSSHPNAVAPPGSQVSFVESNH